MKGIEVQFFTYRGEFPFSFIPTIAFDICRREKFPYVSILFIAGRKNKGIRFYRKDKEDKE